MRLPFLTVLAAVALGSAGSCQKLELRRPAFPPPPAPVAEDPAPPRPPPAGEAVRAAMPPRAAAAPARLGLLAPLSGRYAAYGKAYLDGAQLAVDAFNDRGPMRVELAPADSKGEPISALAATRRLVDSVAVVAILGGVLNLPTLVAGVEANCSRVPMLSNVATEEGIGSIGPYVFHRGPSRQRAARAGADLAVFVLRRFRAAVLYPEAGDGRALATAFSERLTALGGELVASESYAAGTTDFTTLVQRLRGAEPEVLYLPASAEEVLLIAPALVFQGLAAQVIGTEEWNSERPLRAGGADLEGALLPAAEAPDGDLERFRRQYRARFSAPDNRFAAAGFQGANCILDLLAERPGSGREALRGALAERLQMEGRSRGETPRFLIVRDGEARPFVTP